AGVGMVGTDGAWSTQRFVDPADLRHDMHVNIVTLQPGASITFPETHAMEHGLFVLTGKAGYLLHTDRAEAAAGDAIGRRAYCPQACCAGCPGEFSGRRYEAVYRHGGRSRWPSRRAPGPVRRAAAAPRYDVRRAWAGRVQASAAGAVDEERAVAGGTST